MLEAGRIRDSGTRDSGFEGGERRMTEDGSVPVCHCATVRVCARGARCALRGLLSVESVTTSLLLAYFPDRSHVYREFLLSVHID